MIQGGVCPKGEAVFPGQSRKGSRMLLASQFLLKSLDLVSNQDRQVARARTDNAYARDSGKGPRREPTFHSQHYCSNERTEPRTENISSTSTEVQLTHTSRTHTHTESKEFARASVVSKNRILWINSWVSHEEKRQYQGQEKAAWNPLLPSFSHLSLLYFFCVRVHERKKRRKNLARRFKATNSQDEQKRKGSEEGVQRETSKVSTLTSNNQGISREHFCEQTRKKWTSEPVLCPLGEIFKLFLPPPSMIWPLVHSCKPCFIMMLISTRRRRRRFGGLVHSSNPSIHASGYFTRKLPRETLSWKGMRIMRMVM